MKDVCVIKELFALSGCSLFLNKMNCIHEGTSSTAFNVLQIEHLQSILVLRSGHPVYGCITWLSSYVISLCSCFVYIYKQQKLK